MTVCDTKGSIELFSFEVVLPDVRAVRVLVFVQAGDAAKAPRMTEKKWMMNVRLL